jgi:acetyl-CoA synthetase
MPMTAELPITMLACARLGVIHSEVFAITTDAYYRSGKLLDHKEKADIAADEAKKEGHKVDKVLVWQRYPGKHSSPTAMVNGRDYAVNDLLKDYRGKKVEPEHMLAEEPLFLMYTSGTTGKPKGAQHSTGGYLAYVAGTSKYVQDIQPEDVYWCMADIGWITGHSYIVYGPLAVCASSVIYEGLPNYPDAGRPWRIAEELDVNIFHTSPTAIRALRKVGADEPPKYNYHFKHMTTVGEPIEPQVWKWYYEVVGKGEAAVVDTWWQTETGGFLCSTMPALQPMKPGSAGRGVPGIHPIIYDEDGKEILRGAGKAGNICIQNPWPGIMQTIWGDPDRFVAVYYSRYCKDKNSKDWRDWPYMAGDGALGTKELESAALIVPEVAESAVVAVQDEIKGIVPDLYVSLKPGVDASDGLRKKVSEAIVREIGPIARPKNVWIVPDMPKTRSGKIMRRVLAAISNEKDVGDVTSLANPEIVDEIRAMGKT